MVDPNLKKLVILFSGNGSNMQNLVEKLHNKHFDNLKTEIVALITNNKEAYGIKRAERLGIPCEVLEHKEFSQREEYDAALVKKIATLEPDIVLLAGFMRILTPIFTDRFKTLNIHPSLLPLFKGKNGLKESYESNMDECGVTVHLVNEELDGGEIIEQARLQRIEGESFDSFEARIHLLEYETYPRAVIRALQG